MPGSTLGQPGVNLASTWVKPGVKMGQLGVNMGTTWGQPTPPNLRSQHLCNLDLFACFEECDQAVGAQVKFESKV